MVIGALDPLEGLVLILPGTGVAWFGAWRPGSRFRTLLAWAFGLVALGVAAMVAMTAAGGVGGRSGRSGWWALTAAPYPIGWVMGLVGAVRSLREGAARNGGRR
jgi:hypothetical protein